MDHIFDHYKKTGYLHHAYIIEGAYDEVTSLLVSAIGEHLGIETKNNPDLSVASYDSFGINEARMLAEMQARAAFGDARKIFIIGARSCSPEAQNALLKTFEEPTVGTHFFLVVPRVEMLLPTLRSRAMLVSGARAPLADEAKKLAEKFLDTSLEDRLALAKKLADHKKGESVDRDLIRRIFDHLERILYTRLARRKGEQDIFRELFQAKTYLADSGSSPKMLLEHLAITIPSAHDIG